MKKLLLTFIVVSCAGCTKVWTHSSKGQQEFYQDSARCEAMSNSAGSGQMMYGGSDFANGWNQGTAIGSTISRKRIFNNCMMGEGWELRGGEYQTSSRYDTDAAANKLRKLNQLRDANKISQEEYKLKEREILDSM